MGESGPYTTAVLLTIVDTSIENQGGGHTEQNQTQSSSNIDRDLSTLTLISTQEQHINSEQCNTDNDVIHDILSIERRAKKDPSRYVANQSIQFDTLPAEIRELVYKCMTDVPEIVDVSIKVKRRRSQYHRANRFKNFFPRAVKIFERLLATSQLISQEVDDFIGRTCVFDSRHSQSFHALPEVFGPDNLALIRRFSLKMEWAMKCRHEGDKNWPRALRVLCEHLVNLEHFEFYSEWAASAGAFPYNETRDPVHLIDSGTITRRGQETRAKLRFLAWLILRHPDLDRLLVLANTDQLPAPEVDYTVKDRMVAAKY